jgi:hypothetical protein
MRRPILLPLTPSWQQFKSTSVDMTGYAEIGALPQGDIAHEDLFVNSLNCRTMQ